MKINGLMSVLVASMSLQANAMDLSTNEGVSVLFINGQDASEKHEPYVIQDGFNQVVVQVETEVGSGGSAQYFESKPYVISFEATGEQATIAAPKLHSVMQAKKVFKQAQPGWKVKVDGRVINAMQEQLQGKKGFLPYANIDELIEKHNQTRGIVFEKGQPVNSLSAATSRSIGATGTTAETPVEQLKRLYLLSSEEERKAFRRWIIDQD